MSEQVNDKPVHCPHCGGDLSFEVVTKVADRSRVAFTLTPAPGEMMCAKTIGGSIEAIEKLFVSVGKDMGVKTKALVENISTAEDGTITVKLLLTRQEIIGRAIMNMQPR